MKKRILSFIITTILMFSHSTVFSNNTNIYAADSGYIPQKEYAQVVGKYKYGAPINNNDIGDSKYFYHTGASKKLKAIDKKTLKEYIVFKYKHILCVAAITDKYFFLDYGVVVEDDGYGKGYAYGLLRIDKNGKNPKILIKANSDVSNCYVVGKYIYTTKIKNEDEYVYSIYRMNLDGKKGKYLKKAEGIGGEKQS